MVIFVTEAILMGLLGGIAGVGAGVGMGYLLTTLTNSGGPGAGRGSAAASGGLGISAHITPVFEPTFIAEVILITVIFSLFAGIIPAYRASRIEPAVALRYEV